MTRIRMPKKKRFTVILLYPDYMSDGTETFHAFVKARNRAQAIEHAQSQMMVDNAAAQGGDDFLPLAVFAGWIDEAE